MSFAAVGQGQNGSANVFGQAWPRIEEAQQISILRAVV
jgi:hypothetical protein